MASPDRTESDDQPMSGAFTWPRLGLFAAVLALAAVLLPSTQADRQTSESLTSQFALRDGHAQIEATLESRGIDGDNPLAVRLRLDSSLAVETRIRSELERIGGLRLREGADSVVRVDVAEHDDGDELQLRAELDRPDATPVPLAEQRRRIGRWTAVLPPVLAILVALFFRRLVLGLGSAVWLGAALQVDFAPLRASWLAVRQYLWKSVADPFNLAIIGFTFSLVGMVHVVIRMGGIAGLVETFEWMAKSARSTRISVVLMGLAIFFDDYANTVVVGSSMRPLTDDKRISREKLAYLVDSTSAPIAGLAVVSTWIGYEVGLFGELSRQMGLGMSGYEIFFEIVWLRFYCLFTLVFVAALAVSGKDFGPMLAAERRARETGDVLRPGSTPMSGGAAGDVEPAEGIPYRWYNAVVPILVVVLGTVFGMFWSGWRPTAGGTGIPDLFALVGGEATPGTFTAALGSASGDLFSATAWREALSEARNAQVLFWSSVCGSAVAGGLAVGQDLLDPRETLRAWFRSIPMMTVAVAVLVLAWSIQAVCTDLGTGIYLVGAVQDLVWPRTLPLLTFALAGVVAFATGTSWGTMGILLPAMLPLAQHVTSPSAASGLLLMMCFGAVLDGAIFGDHCSPLSDTTVMSSIGAGVDHIDHVRTQIPYALTSMLASALFGYLGVAVGLPVGLALVLGAGSLVVTVAIFGCEPGRSET